MLAACFFISKVNGFCLYKIPSLGEATAISSFRGRGFFISRVDGFCLYRIPSLGEVTAISSFRGRGSVWGVWGTKEQEEREHYHTFCNQNTGIERE